MVFFNSLINRHCILPSDNIHLRSWLPFWLPHKGMFLKKILKFQVWFFFKGHQDTKVNLLPFKDPFFNFSNLKLPILVSFDGTATSLTVWAFLEPSLLSSIPQVRNCTIQLFDQYVCVTSQLSVVFVLASKCTQTGRFEHALCQETLSDEERKHKRDRARDKRRVKILLDRLFLSGEGSRFWYDARWMQT